jgi:hypothetical protein
MNPLAQLAEDARDLLLLVVEQAGERVVQIDGLGR